MIEVTKTFLPEREKLLSYIDDIYRSGWITNDGALLRELERRLEAYLGVRHVLAVANGTLALQVAFKLLDLKGEVVTSPFTFVATASSLVWEGLEPVFVDIDPHTLNLDAARIERAITSKTGALLPVHVFGNPCAVEDIGVLAQRLGLPVIYDASHAFGVRYRGESLLRWGDIATLSFHATKVFHTIEGGALVINDDALYERARKMINFGIAGPESIEMLGINAKMNEFEAAMGLCLLDSLEDRIVARKRIARFYDDHLPASLVRQQRAAGATENHGYYPVLFESEDVLQQSQRRLLEKDVRPRRYFYPPLNELPFLGGGHQAAPVASDVSRRILCLPIYPGLSVDDCGMIVDVITAVVGE
ncbi:MAG: DegT/DnrJ/EryC1/StrS family aminotransferase [Mariprofundaceae bacterium]